jgi:hypothetical protein
MPNFLWAVFTSCVGSFPCWYVCQFHLVHLGVLMFQ